MYARIMSGPCPRWIELRFNGLDTKLQLMTTIRVAYRN